MRPLDYNPETGTANVAFEGFDDCITALVLIGRWGTRSGLDREQVELAAKLLAQGSIVSDACTIVTIPDTEEFLHVLSMASLDAIPHAQEMIKSYESHFVLNDAPLLASVNQ